MRTMGFVLLALGALHLALGEANPPTHGMVAADHELASRAGAEVLAAGGNAADAAVATALACGVVQPSSSGLGGGGFAVITTKGKSAVLDFREVAPGRAHADMYLDPAGEVVEGASTTGGLAVAVPGEPRGLVALWREHGRLELERIAAPAIRLATDGFAAGAHLLGAMERRPEVVFSSVWPLPDTTRIRRPRLAGAISAWARTRGEALVSGGLGEDLVSAVQQAGGVLTQEDLAHYQPVSRAVLRGQYRGHEILTMPPPSSGGVVLLQVLAVLESTDLGGLTHNGPQHIHRLAEAMQHAYADRAATMGDPAFVTVPVDKLLSQPRIEKIRVDFDPAKTYSRSHYGTNLAPVEDGGTQHISVLDSEGNAVALTTTINTGFGSGVVAPQSSIVLNNEMDDFVAKPGHPNAYGLIGRAANAVAPGKKPLSSMTPTIVNGIDGKPLLAIGASGGPFIISSTLQVLSNILDFGMTPEAAVSAPRMHHQWVPELLFLDEGFAPETHQGLTDIGHVVKEMGFFSSVQIVQSGPEGFLGASDPHKGGAPASSPRP